jgi:NADH-quinone oxidoreductase subunit C
MNNSLKKSLESAFKGIQIHVPEEDRVIVEVEKDQALSVLKLLKEKGYAHMALVSCVDWIEEKEFELVYVLSAYLQNSGEYTEREKTNIILKTRIPRDNPRFFTVIPIFQNSEPYEREIHELFGIHFEGHPRLIPLFLERDYKIPPFRKDFDTRQYIKEVFDAVPFVKDKNK